ncbi:MAG: hypothetical protein Q8J89_16185 [Caulobacter sp.]|nr:hypothetical protein [Caulobacter sp.]
MKMHLAKALGALLLCLAGPALGQVPKGWEGPRDVGPDPRPLPKITDVAISKSAVGTVIAGQTATFVLQVTNNGTTSIGGPGPGLIVSEYGFVGLQGPMAGSGTNWSCSGGNFSLQCTWVGGPVAPGAGFPPITVTLVAQDRPTYQNCARIEVLKGTDMRPGNNQSCITGRIAKPLGGYDASIRKDGPGTITYGQLSSFTIQVTNTGQSSVDASAGLTVVDQVPSAFAGVTASGVGWTCNVSSSLVTCTYTGPPVGPNLQFPTITIQGKAGKIGSYLNCAGVEFRKVASNSPRDNKDCAEGVIRKDAEGYDLGIRKTYKPPSKPGGPATFMIYPTNNGPSSISSASGVRVVDTLPSNFQPTIIGSGNNWNCATTGGGPWTVVCTYTGPSVGPGPLPPIEILANVAEAGRFRNCAEITIEAGRDLNPRDNTSCVDGEVGNPTGNRPDISLTKTALKQPWSWPSGTGVYQFKIANVGDAPVPAGHTFTLTENLPAGMVLVATPVGWSCSPGSGTVGAATVTCNYTSAADLNPGGFIQFDMTVGFTDKRQPSYQNCASVVVYGRDRPWSEVDMRNNRDCEPVEVVWPKPANDMQIQKESNSPVMVGQSMTFVLYPTNLGPGSVDAGSGIVVTDTLPSLFSAPVTITAPGWTCPPPSGLSVNCSYTGPGVFGLNQSLPPITLSAVATTAGQTQNCAQVAIPGDPVAGNNQGCAPVLVRQPSLPLNLKADKEAVGLWPPQVGPGFWFRLSATNTSTNPIPAGTVLTIIDNLPAGMRLDSQAGGFTCTPIGLVGPGPVTCTITLTAPMLPTAMEIADIQVSYVGPVQPAYENCITLSASVAETTLDDNSDCATATPSTPTPPSLEIEKVVEQDCSGTYPYTACKFMIRIFNTGSTVYTGPLTFTDTVTGPSGITISGVSLTSPQPSGWNCSGAQPMTCSITSATIPVNGHITIPIYMTINGAIPPQQNCAVLTAPVSAQSCVEMGSTHFDLGLASTIIETDLALNGATFEFFVSSTPTLANGAQLVFNGSVVTPATFAPPGISSATVSDTPLWSCVGPWSGFVCTLNVSSGAWSGGLIPLRLKVFYNTLHVGLPVTFTGQIQMNGNADPVPSNNTTSVTTVLP